MTEAILIHWIIPFFVIAIGVSFIYVILHSLPAIFEKLINRKQLDHRVIETHLMCPYDGGPLCNRRNYVPPETISVCESCGKVCPRNNQ
jgi:hypothetical protein